MWVVLAERGKAGHCMRRTCGWLVQKGGGGLAAARGAPCCMRHARTASPSFMESVRRDEEKEGMKAEAHTACGSNTGRAHAAYVTAWRMGLPLPGHKAALHVATAGCDSPSLFDLKAAPPRQDSPPPGLKAGMPPPLDGRQQTCA
eukprot:365783-Chlamydomonas_euryale.AAC.19